MKKYNFNPGPSILPQYTIDKSIEALKDFAGTGLSILEVSHRSKEFEAVMNEVVALFKELMNIPEGYAVLFLGGGASTQFFTVPYNLLKTKAAYLKTGHWASEAIKEAKLFGEVVVVASSEDKNYIYIPKGYKVPDDADYFHITTNNTIYGTEIFEDPLVKMPLIADMSSDIMSRKIDVSKYGLIYAGAQKNLGPAGVTVLIVKESILGKVDRPLPTMVDYRTHIAQNSLRNTPPCFNIVAVLETMRWVKAQGGVAEMEKRNKAKAKLLYDEIDRNKLFVDIANKEDRSRMNLCFVMAEPYKELEKEFDAFSSSKGMIGIKGHRSVGGFRASLYNAMPIESVQALVDCMQEFEKAKAT
ncbi:MAG: 3-phosphoserine/phosphohydroxythreonine transaminase [Anaerolineales bacterium]|nr:3-phosphoserine/phosphohydroxythreonine transaminase [Anaerolineales bacterium]